MESRLRKVLTAYCSMETAMLKYTNFSIGEKTFVWNKDITESFIIICKTYKLFA